jgi:hypothetical protein
MNTRLRIRAFYCLFIGVVVSQLISVACALYVSLLSVSSSYGRATWPSPPPFSDWPERCDEHNVYAGRGLRIMTHAFVSRDPRSIVTKPVVFQCTITLSGWPFLGYRASVWEEQHSPPVPLVYRTSAPPYMASRTIPLYPNSWRAAASVGFYSVLVYAGIGVMSYCRAALRRRRGRCPSCGYDLLGLNSPTCPECGTTCRYDAGRREARTARR